MKANKKLTPEEILIALGKSDGIIAKCLRTHYRIPPLTQAHPTRPAHGRRVLRQIKGSGSRGARTSLGKFGSPARQAAAPKRVNRALARKKKP